MLICQRSSPILSVANVTVVIRTPNSGILRGALLFSHLYLSVPATFPVSFRWTCLFCVPKAPNSSDAHHILNCAFNEPIPLCAFLFHLHLPAIFNHVLAVPDLPQSTFDRWRPQGNHPRRVAVSFRISQMIVPPSGLDAAAMRHLQFDRRQSHKNFEKVAVRS